MKLNKMKQFIDQIIEKYKANPRQLIFAGLLIFFVAMGVTSAIVLLNTRHGYRKAQDDYVALRKFAPVSGLSDPEPDASPSAATEPVPSNGLSGPEPPAISESAQVLLDINPDYIGWLNIEDTKIDYPVVQGKDNGQYIKTDFSGERSAAGTIFMDWKCKETFSSPFAVLFGHNMKDGSMFASLHSFRDKAYLEAHPNITVVTPWDEVLTYRIFSVRLTDISDKVFSLFDKEQEDIKKYFAEHNAPEGANCFLVLSTCTKGGSDNERLLVFAVLEE